jgi:hypothetical protein
MTEEHGDELAPAAEPSGMAFCPSLFDDMLEFRSWKELQKLAKHATKPIHRSSLDAVVDFWRNQFTTFLREDLFFLNSNLDETVPRY